MPRPMPLVEPVTRAVLPLSMAGLPVAGCYDAAHYPAPPEAEDDRTALRTPPAQRACLGSRGLHRMAYWEWGDAGNPRVLVCVHGLSRQGRDFDTLARDLCADYRVICPDVVGRGRTDRLADPMGYAHPQLRGRHGDAGGAAGRGAGWTGSARRWAASSAWAWPACRARRCGDWCSTTWARRSSPRRCDASASYLGQPAHWRTRGGGRRRAAGHLAGFRPAHARAVAGADAAATRARSRPPGRWLQAALRPGHRGALPRHHARVGRGRRGHAVAELRPPDLPDAAAARRRVRPACRTTPRWP